MTEAERLDDLEKRIAEIERHLFNAAWQTRIKGLINKDGK